MANVMVTGASGFLGRHLVRHLLASGHQVTATGHRCDMAGVPAEATKVNVELCSAGSVESMMLLARPSHVVHAAALTQTTYCQQNVEEAFEVNVGGTRNLLESAALLDDPPHFLYVSTDLVFDGELGRPYVETDATNPIMTYGETKLVAESEVRSPDYPGLVTILRTALMYGQPGGMRPSFLDWMITGISRREGTLFSDEFRTPVLVDDVCKCIANAIEHETGGLFHVGGHDRLSRAEFGHLVATAFELDAAGVRPASLREAMAKQLLPAPRPADVSLNSTRARELLGHEPEPTSEILERLARRSAI